jgi:tetrahydromethanopterin S-methyltransferase subunit B
MTPDKQFILDNHPGWKNVIIGAGFSGNLFYDFPVEITFRKRTLSIGTTYI